MGDTIPITARVPKDISDFIDQLVANGRYRNRTAFLLEAILELKSQFTGEPTIRNLDARQKNTEFRLGKVERNLAKVMEVTKVDPAA